RAVAAGTDLLCLGRDQDQLSYLAVRDALIAAVASGRLPGARLEEAAARVAGLRAWISAARLPSTPLPVAEQGLPSPPEAASEAPDGSPAPAGLGRAAPRRGQAPDGAPAHTELGLAAARRAQRVSGDPVLPLRRPVLVEVVPPANIAVGPVPWGLAPWAPADSLIRVGTGAPARDLAAAAGRALAAAAGRSLVVVVRDAHRHPAAQALVTRLLAARPDTVVVEMGLPVWRPPGGGY